MANLRADIDTTRINRLLMRLSRQSPKMLGELVRDEAGLAALWIARGLPPRKVGQGRRKVAADVRRVFITANVAYREMRARAPEIAKAFWKAYKNGDNARAAGLMREAGVPFADAVFLDRPDPDIHRRARSKATGRVLAKQPAAIVRDAGSLRDYLRGRQMMVGYLKSPWAKVAQALGKRAPAWMTRPDGPHILEDETRRLLTPSITIGSAVEFADNRRFAAAIDRAMRGREEALVKRVEKGFARLRTRL